MKKKDDREGPTAIRFSNGLKEELRHEGKLASRSLNYMVNFYLKKRKKVTQKDVACQGI